MKYLPLISAMMMLTASAALADSALSDIGSAAKDAATQTAKQKAQEKLGTSTLPSAQTVPTAQSVKDAAKDKAKEKAQDATGAAIDKALGK